MAVVRTKERLDGAVARTRLVLERERRERHTIGKLCAERARQRRHCVVAGGAARGPFPDLTGAVRRLAALEKRLLELSEIHARRVASARMGRSEAKAGARRTPWPLARARKPGQKPHVGIVVASSNTKELIAHLVFSLYRLLGRGEFAQLVVVDNSSRDGSLELLGALDRAGLIRLIRNRRQRYHGPALTQGVSWLARRQAEVDQRHRIDYVWVLDSDVIVLRPDTVENVVGVLDESGAAAVGEASFDPWHGREMLQPFSLMLDPALAWQRPLPAFEERGDPSAPLQLALEARGFRVVGFPFVAGGYVLHLGRGTLRAIADSGDVDNRYYEWALDHRDYHFAGNPGGSDVYDAFRRLFAAEVAELRPESLVEACLGSRLLELE